MIPHSSQADESDSVGSVSGAAGHHSRGAQLAMASKLMSAGLLAEDGPPRDR